MSEQKNLEEVCNTIHHYLYNLKEGEAEMKITDLMNELNEEERVAIAKMYKDLYSNEGIEEDIKDVIDHRNMVRAFQDLFTTRVDNCCKQIKKRLGYFVSLENDTIFEILCESPKWLLRAIIERYPELYGVSLEDEISEIYYSDVKRNILRILKNKRRVNANPDDQKCEEYASLLEQNPPETWGTNEDIFNEIFAKCSPEELCLIGKKYFQHTGKTFCEVIDTEMQGRMRCLFKELLYGLLNPAEFYAEKLRKAMKIEGVDCYHLGRIIISRFELDMPLIKKYYQSKYNTELAEDIDKATTGFYSRLLLTLINKMDNREQFNQNQEADKQ